MISVADSLNFARALGLDRLDAQLLLLHALGKPDTERAWLIAHDADELPEPVAQLFDSFSQRRAAGEPLAYIVGYKEFFGLRFAVDARVLVPRPDTETLVQWALDALKDAAGPEVLDLGTGSGAIALAIARNLAHKKIFKVTASDFSEDALVVASHNAQYLGVNLQLLHSNWLNKVSGRYHVIVSNPPYITSTDPHLPALRHEPAMALIGGADGLSDIRQIVNQAPQHLYPGGCLLLEHGHDQASAIQHLLTQRGFAHVQSRGDLAGIARCTGGTWRE